MHVSWHDASAFAAWAGARLPTEAEWERGARGGLEGAAFPWGDEREPAGEHRMNVWQGTFPSANTLDDGFLGTSPVGAFPPNGLGLLDTTGNVWEWVADWFAPTHPDTPVVDPTGPDRGASRVQRGGSYLCHESLLPALPGQCAPGVDAGLVDRQRRLPVRRRPVLGRRSLTLGYWRAMAMRWRSSGSMRWSWSSSPT